MVRTGVVLVNNEPAGNLSYHNGEYIFRYNDDYFINDHKKAISVTLRKTQQEYRSKILFPFFFNMLSEGVNRNLQCRQLQIDENDYFGLLLAIGGTETIGAVSVKSISEL
ncbi:MAG: HipA N-terminal domain-containing protein [Bacteroidota bacterium]|nr:HipA N-terminal domain-containing protein [Bacteroidota bacterium]